MSNLVENDLSLESDARFEDPLQRVAFEPGMLLGVDATRTEQDYHRRRINRHQYWLHGYGTVAGLPVVATSESESNADVHMLVRILVRPGIAIDGLGREVSLYEPYCLDLKQWLEAHADDDRRWLVEKGGFNEADNELWLNATVRYQDTSSGLSPVMARKVNAGTDPVAATRVKDSVQLTLTPDYPPPGVEDNPPWGTPAHAAGFRPGRGHGVLPEESPLNSVEQTYLATLEGDASRLAQLQGALLYSLPEDNTALELRGRIDRLAEVLLARIRITLGPDRLVICNPNRIEINNLVRPFVTTTEQLAHLHRNPPAE